MEKVIQKQGRVVILFPMITRKVTSSAGKSPEKEMFCPRELATSHEHPSPATTGAKNGILVTCRVGYDATWPGDGWQPARPLTSEYPKNGS